MRKISSEWTSGFRRPYPEKSADCKTMADIRISANAERPEEDGWRVEYSSTSQKASVASPTFLLKNSHTGALQAPVERTFGFHGCPPGSRGKILTSGCDSTTPTTASPIMATPILSGGHGLVACGSPNRGHCCPAENGIPTANSYPNKKWISPRFSFLSERSTALLENPMNLGKGNRGLGTPGRL